MDCTRGKPIRCRGAVCREGGEPLVVEEVVVAPPRAFEVRMRILCTSLCHSDLTFWGMKGFPGVFPRIFGHEAIGVVESVGDGVEDVAEGDTVVPTFLGQCNNCIDCASNKSNMCKIGFRLQPGLPSDGTSRFTDTKGNEIHNFLNVSSFVEYTVVDVTFVTKVTASAPIPPEMVCLLSCGVSTGVGAAWKVAAVHKGSTVAIFGLGAVGLAVAEGAKLRGASKIIGVDLNPDKFEIGKKFGVTDFVNPKDLTDGNISEVIKEMTDGGADYCFECIGLASLMNTAYESCRQGWGKTVILGVEKHGAPLSIDSINLLQGRTITGSLFGGIKPKSDIPMLINKYLDKELQLEKFITHEVTFEDVNKAFDMLIRGESLRCIIWMNK